LRLIRRYRRRQTIFAYHSYLWTFTVKFDAYRSRLQSRERRHVYCSFDINFLSARVHLYNIRRFWFKITTPRLATTLYQGLKETKTSRTSRQPHRESVCRRLQLTAAAAVPLCLLQKVIISYTYLYCRYRISRVLWRRGRLTCETFSNECAQHGITLYRLFVKYISYYNNIIVIFFVQCICCSIGITVLSKYDTLSAYVDDRLLPLPRFETAIGLADVKKHQWTTVQCVPVPTRVPKEPIKMPLK